MKKPRRRAQSRHREMTSSMSPWKVQSKSARETGTRSSQLTALETMMSKPPRPSLASVTIRSQSCNIPTSCRNLLVKDCKDFSKQRLSHAFDNERHDLVFFLHFPCHLVCSLLTCIVVDGDIAAFCGKLFGHESSQASAFGSMSTMVCRGDGCNGSTDLEPPVIRTLRPLRLYGIIGNCGESNWSAYRDLLRVHKAMILDKMERFSDEVVLDIVSS